MWVVRIVYLCGVTSSTLRDEPGVDAAVVSVEGAPFQLSLPAQAHTHLIRGRALDGDLVPSRSTDLYLAHLPIGQERLDSYLLLLVLRLAVSEVSGLNIIAEVI